jgi:hypothetical protein
MVRGQDLRDQEGRLLRESRAPAECIRPGEIEYKACPYPGSRKVNPPMPMNTSALRATSAHWEDLINAVALMRMGYETLRGSKRMDVWDVWRVTQLSSALPWYYILGFGELSPAYAANLAKATLGIGIWAQQVHTRMIVDQWTPPTLTPQTIHELAEAGRSYFAAHEVCACPEPMLLRFYEAMLGLTPDTSSPQMTRLVQNLPSVLAFGAHYLNMKLVLYVMFLARRFVYADLAAALPDAAMARPFAELVAEPGLPPDFISVGPRDLAGTPPAQRGAFLAQIAQNLIALAPDGSDQPLCAAVVEITGALASPGRPGGRLVEELANAGMPADRAEIVATAITTWATIDRIHGDTMRVVENGMRRAVDAPAYTGEIGVADRDTLIGEHARRALASIGSREVGALLGYRSS